MPLYVGSDDAHPVQRAQYPRLQKCYLFLGVSVFASVVYFSSFKPQSPVAISRDVRPPASGLHFHHNTDHVSC